MDRTWALQCSLPQARARESHCLWVRHHHQCESICASFDHLEATHSRVKIHSVAIPCQVTNPHHPVSRRLKPNSCCFHSRIAVTGMFAALCVATVVVPGCKLDISWQVKLALVEAYLPAVSSVIILCENGYRVVCIRSISSFRRLCLQTWAHQAGSSSCEQCLT